MQARYYDPVIGRFYSNDPVEAIEHLDGLQSIQGFNRYAYVNNNPYKYIDPSGESAGLAQTLTFEAMRVELKYRVEHYTRNENNQAPRSESAAKKSELGFKQLPAEKSIFHMQGEGGEQNKKYISDDGHHEGVYDGEGNLVTDDVNQGTFNFADPIENPIAHGVQDVLPYMIYGNTPNDPTSVGDRIKIAITQDPQTNEK